MAALTIQTTPGRAETGLQYHRHGNKGTLAVTVMKSGAVGAVTAADAPELAKLVNAALAAG